jgi:hypothetical protein
MDIDSTFGDIPAGLPSLKHEIQPCAAVSFDGR